MISSDLIWLNEQGTLQAGSTKRKRHTSLTAAEAVNSVGVSSLLQGKSRQDASRWFFELLVLRSQGFVQLQQSSPYKDITISAGQRLPA